MLGIRHEEYTEFGGSVPFAIEFGIKRSKTIYSAEVNWHENLEIQLCRAGEGTVMLDGKKISVTAGDIVVVNSGVLHHTGTETEIEYDCLIPDTGLCRLVGIDVTKVCFAEHFRSSEISDLFREIEQVRKSGEKTATAKQYLLALKLLIQLYDAYTVSDSPTPVKPNTYATVTAAITYIRDHFDSKLALDDLAKKIFVNKYTLTRMFKKMTGQTIVEYINQYRCNQAARMIRDGERINESARRYGFTNMSFFTKTFRQYVGCLPSEYKRLQPQPKS